MTIVNLKNLHDQIKHIRFGILHISTKSLVPFSNLLVEAIEIDEHGDLWCLTADSVPGLFLNVKGFKVSLKFVQKQQGLFVKLVGNATVAHYSENMDEPAPDKGVSHRRSHKTMLKIEVLEADLYRKRSLSRYTTILQSVFRFSLKSLVSHPQKARA